MLCSLTIALQLPECTATRRSLPVLSPRLSPGWTLTVLLGSSGWCLDSVCCCRLPRPGPQLSGDKLRVGTMNRLGSVQRKMPCVFVTEVKAEPSAKREHQVPGGVCCCPGALQVLPGRFGWSFHFPWPPASCIFLAARSVGESSF